MGHQNRMNNDPIQAGPFAVGELERLQTSHPSQIMLRASDRHEAGMKKLFDIHEAHAADDIKRFENIDQKFSAAAEAKGVAKQTAKFWGLCAVLPAPILGGLWAI